MARRQIDHGPAVATAVPAVAAALPNIGLTVGAARGPALVRAVVNVKNPAANAPAVTASIRKNGVLLGLATKTIVMIALSTAQIVVEEIDPAPAVGDVYTVEMLTTSALAGHEVGVNAASLLFDANGNDAVYVSEVGAATP